MLRCLLSWLLLLLAATPLCAAPQDAVVRVTSHGCSATVIQTSAGKSYLLSCAHAFEGRDRYRKIVIDAPVPIGAPQYVSNGSSLVRVDYELDLSLIELRAGPLPFLAPVAPAGHRPMRLLSVGYDAMRQPSTVRTATALSSQGTRTYTREIPSPGRSGGALMDAERGYLMGVVQGYELVAPRRGIYSSHEAILRFLEDGPSRQPQRSAPPGGI